LKLETLKLETSISTGKKGSQSRKPVSIRRETWHVTKMQYAVYAAARA